MTYVATVTSKRQFTIPAKLFKQVGLSEGDRVLIEEKEGELRIKPALDLVDRLAGSVSIPPQLQDGDLDEAIAKAKKTYFGTSK